MGKSKILIKYYMVHYINLMCWWLSYRHKSISRYHILIHLMANYFVQFSCFFFAIWSNSKYQTHSNEGIKWLCKSRLNGSFGWNIRVIPVILPWTFNQWCLSHCCRNGSPTKKECTYILNNLNECQYNSSSWIFA